MLVQWNDLGRVGVLCVLAGCVASGGSGPSSEKSTNDEAPCECADFPPVTDDSCGDANPIWECQSGAEGCGWVRVACSCDVSECADFPPITATDCGDAEPIHDCRRAPEEGSSCEWQVTSCGCNVDACADFPPVTDESCGAADPIWDCQRAASDNPQIQDLSSLCEWTAVSCDDTASTPECHGIGCSCMTDADCDVGLGCIGHNCVDTEGF